MTITIYMICSPTGVRCLFANLLLPFYYSSYHHPSAFISSYDIDEGRESQEDTACNYGNDGKVEEGVAYSFSFDERV